MRHRLHVERRNGRVATGEHLSAPRKENIHNSKHTQNLFQKNNYSAGFAGSCVDPAFYISKKQSTSIGVGRPATGAGGLALGLLGDRLPSGVGVRPPAPAAWPSAGWRIGFHRDRASGHRRRRPGPRLAGGSASKYSHFITSHCSTKGKYSQFITYKKIISKK